VNLLSLPIVGIIRHALLVIPPILDVLKVGWMRAKEMAAGSWTLPVCHHRIHQIILKVHKGATVHSVQFPMVWKLVPLRLQMPMMICCGNDFLDFTEYCDGICKVWEAMS